jgi:hypothetical protein|tara:strand:- start:2141 stop:2314 length:174 start_codon:yes stop_codon:yes gene_type:complete
MSLTELVLIIFISVGILDKKKLKKYLEIFSDFNKGPTRKIIGDSSLNENWKWIGEEE